MSMLVRKNRSAEAYKLLKDIDRKELVLNEEFVRSKYCLLKKIKEDEAEKFITEVSTVNPQLGFCVMTEFAVEKNNEKKVLQTLQNRELSTNEAIKNYIFSLLIRDESLFEQYSQYLDELIQNSTETPLLEVLLKLYESKGDLPKQKLILSRILQINPKNTVARVGLASQYLEEGKVEEAEHELRGIEGPEEITDHNYLLYI